MRLAKGWVVVGLLALVAPAGALRAGVENRRLADERVAASAVVEGGGSLLSHLIARLGAVLSLVWGEARGIIVPGAEDTTTSTAVTGTGND